MLTLLINLRTILNKQRDTMDSSNNNYIIGYTLEKSVLIINLIFIIFLFHFDSVCSRFYQSRVTKNDKIHCKKTNNRSTILIHFKRKLKTKKIKFNPFSNILLARCTTAILFDHPRNRPTRTAVKRSTRMFSAC